MAKRFVFRLKTVLKLRQRKEDECRRVVAARLRRVADIRSRVAAHETAIREAHGTIRSDQERTRLDPVAARRNHAYVHAMRNVLARARSELNEENVHLRAEQGRLIEASRDVKVIEKLKERMRQRHLEDEARRERFEADEIALQLYRRTRGQRPYGVEAAA